MQGISKVCLSWATTTAAVDQGSETAQQRAQADKNNRQSNLPSKKSSWLVLHNPAPIAS